MLEKNIDWFKSACLRTCVTWRDDSTCGVKGIPPQGSWPQIIEEHQHLFNIMDCKIVPPCFSSSCTPRLHGSHGRDSHTPLHTLHFASSPAHAWFEHVKTSQQSELLNVNNTFQFSLANKWAPQLHQPHCWTHLLLMKADFPLDWSIYGPHGLATLPSSRPLSWQVLQQESPRDLECSPSVKQANSETHCSCP